MEENLLHIFCCYLADLFETKRFDRNDLGYILEQFKPYCDKLKSRQDLINFIDPFIPDYPEFAELKSQLQDQNYKFNF